MVPLVKGYSTEMSLEVASLGVQVHGGMGFIEETGAAQYLRDARILTIYEGTTAIQANDLVGRKTARDGGRTRQGDRRADRRDRGRARRPARAPPRARCASACAPRARRSSRWSTSSSRESKAQPERRVRRLGALPDARRQRDGRLADGARAARRRAAARRTARATPPSSKAKIATARFYAEHLLSKAPGPARRIVDGADSVTALALDAF